MIGSELDVHAYNLKTVFNQYKRLQVPAFQRPYEWDQKNWEPLWDDLRENRETDYLLGGITLCGTDEDGELVIDGQQRLATLTMIAAVLRDKAAALDDLDLANEIHKDLIVAGGRLADRKEPYLSLGSLDQEWFGVKVQIAAGDKRHDPPSPDKRNPYGVASSNRTMWKGYVYFWNRLEESLGRIESKSEKLAEIEAVARQIKDHIYFVVTRVPNDDAAYILFEALNDRGLDLTISDLIKNLIFLRAKKFDELESADAAWKRVVRLIGNDPLTPLVRYSWMRRNGEKATERELFGKVKKEVRAMSKQAFQKWIADFEKEAKAYGEIALLENAVIKDPRLVRALRSIKLFGFRVATPLLLSAWSKYEDSKSRLAVVSLVENFLVNYSTFAKQVTNRLEYVFAKLAYDLEEGAIDIDGLKAELRKELPKDDVIESGFLELEPKMNVARAILEAIEAHLSDPKGEKEVKGSSEVHIEHIFPQSQPEHWVKAFKADKDELDAMGNRLGNLTLLSKPLNEEIQNKAIGEKAAEAYCESELKINDELKQLKTWTAKDVMERQKRMFEIVEKIWDLRRSKKTRSE